MPRRLWGVLLLLLLLPNWLTAQVLPGTGGPGTALTFPPSACVNQVGIGIDAQGLLQCATVLPGMTSGLVPSGVDISTNGQVAATHLAAPLPVIQGGLGITSGTSGGLPYFSSPTTVASSPLLPLNAPVFGGGVGQSPTTGTRSGTTLELATVTGPHTPGTPLVFDANGNVIASTIDIGGSPVLSLFGRVGAVTAQTGDYTATQVTNAADLTAPNVFSHASGQTMTRLVLPGSSTGTLSLRAPAVAGNSLLTLPAGTTDFSVTGGAGFVLRQSSPGAPLTVGALAFSDLLGTSTVCTTTSVCTGYQASLGYSAENTGNKSTDVALGVSTTLYPTQSAVKSYVDTALSAKQSTVTWGAGLTISGATASVASTEAGFLTNGGATDLTAGAGQYGKIQVLANGQLQYTDGASTALLWTGVLTQTNLRWNVAPNTCISDPNGGKLTVNSSNEIICAVASGVTSVASVFGRSGIVLAQNGDYTAAQVSNAADVTAANVFAHASGQSMRQLLLPGAMSGTLTVKAPAIAGASTLTFPAGTTDFSATGGAGQVLRQSSTGGAFTVGQLSATDLTNGTTGTGALVLATNPSLPKLANLSQNGFVKTSGGDGTLGIDASTYLTANQTITVSGDASGSGTTTLSLTVSKLNGGAFTGVAGNLVSFGTNNTPADSTVGAGTLVTAPSPWIAGRLLQAAGNNRTASDSGVNVASLCTTTSVCAGYQAAVTFGTGLSLASSVVNIASTQAGFLTNGGVTPLVGGSNAYGRIQVLADGRLQYTDGAEPAVVHQGYLVASLGAAGALQLSTSQGGLTAFSGSACTDPNAPLLTGLLANGTAQCVPSPVTPFPTHVVTDRAEAGFPNAVSLGTLAAGLLLTTPNAGVAGLTTVAMPAGALVGTTAHQTLTDTEVNPRLCPADNASTTIALDLNACNMLTVANLGQDVTLANPNGTAAPGQWLRMQICSALPRAIIWGNQWSAEAGVPLPTVTQGGGSCDLFLFQYNAATSHMALIHNVGILRQICPPSLTPGSYTNANLTVSAQGCITSVSTGAGGGGSTAAGSTGDVQFNKGGGLLGSDPGQFVYDPQSHQLVTVGVQYPLGGSFYKFTDLLGHVGYFFPPSQLARSRVWLAPDEDGEFCVQGGSCFLAPTIPRLANLTTNGLVRTSGGNGTLGVDTAVYATVSGTPSTGQAAEWSSAAVVQGVATTGSGSYVKGTGPTLAAPTIAKLANLTVNGFVRTSGGDGTLNVDNVDVQPLTSASTYTCVRNATFNQCTMANTASSGSITVAAPSGTPQDGDRMLLRLRCTNSQSLVYDAIFINTLNVTPPTTCPANTNLELVLGALYSGPLAKWMWLASTN